MKLSPSVRLVAMVILVAASVDAQAQADTAAVDRAVISNLSAQLGIHSNVIRHLDLTRVFQTESTWSLVVTKQPDEQSSVEDGGGERVGAVHFCFVQNGQPDCSEKMFLGSEQKLGFNPEESLFHIFLASDIVFSGPGSTLPLLKIKACPNRGANGNCAVSTYLFAHDQAADKFRVVFFNVMGRNNNEEARFVESGPLLGAVIVAYPALNPPFTYFVEVHKRNSDGGYSQVLRYRGHTGYGDGNPLSVIDSEMPETLRRLGLWNPGDPLPIPPRMPKGCTRLVMRKGVEWCETR